MLLGRYDASRVNDPHYENCEPIVYELYFKYIV
jgi:hypothetical protein